MRQRALTLFPSTSRHADSTIQLWLQKLKDSPSAKRLNLIYLANGRFPKFRNPVYPELGADAAHSAGVLEFEFCCMNNN